MESVAVEYLYEKFAIDAAAGAVGYSAICARCDQTLKEKTPEAIKDRVPRNDRHALSAN